MSYPRLPRGACLRLGFAAAVLVAVAAGASCADETEGVRWPCGSLDQTRETAHALGGAPFIALTPEQWQFLRGVFVAAPDTPEALPPGDHALMSLRPDGSASVVFVDGNRACAPIKLPRSAVEILMSVGRGDLVRAGQGL